MVFRCPCYDAGRLCNADLTVKVLAAVGQPKDDPARYRVQCPLCEQYVLLDSPRWATVLVGITMVPEVG
jgi:hypothetical protein